MTDVMASPAELELTVEGRALASPAGQSARTSGPLPHLRRGRYLEIEGRDGHVIIPLLHPTLHIGRGMNVDVTVDDSTVSRRHAVIVRRGARTLVLDDRSLNGVFVNGRRVTEAPLRHADVIVLGQVVLRFIEVH